MRKVRDYRVLHLFLLIHLFTHSHIGISSATAGQVDKALPMQTRR